ncbi:isoleucine--tRNA ligase [Companilactobacillus crustorum]|uniref:Isoleucine--tRNA ligase n=3 Tax=Companilactobacillus TaxID=2767879 RepID=A0A837RHU3_9LACO|nr:isoleucine--tRNA ligase [Companilactobacillus crustorum]HCD08159.1 isoleucine--tRNA ligase [Lactobacillus sp.]KRK42780.1 isoleucyl-tRNA synthetase [Companilactobacillus crustorum JCM 15951]KRO20422.1 isoleucyl-tRNA synthetase [Companilactobacillus crustorum]WDT66378.1 isoleucine--tRNA ligase [Companilactobacillus crustorum]GEO76421.1 isoleucine--tRNA ligase [Companilactobacillus crustorum]
MRVKDTLNLGKTKFPMRGNLPNKEAEWQKAWEDNKLYEQRQKLNEGKPTFELLDGPPFANGDIHMGHALNKISKDIIVRYKSMNGFRAPYVPGWDTHGLPIEQQLAKKGVKRKEMSLSDYRKLCYEFAQGEIKKQMAGFKRLGISADWDNPYITYQPEFEEEEVKVFGEMVDKGYIYRGKKPVYWSPSSESTLAEAEVEYKDVKSPSIFVAFKVRNGKDVIDSDASFIIWTTTPWTIPSNEAICVNPKFLYVEVNADGKKYVVAQERLSYVQEQLDWKNVEILKTVKGKDLEGLTATHPLYDRESPLILGNHVTLDDGTGLVHTAPGFGADDFVVGMKYKLPVFSPIDAQGRFTDEVPEYEGVFYDDANKMISERMKDNGSLLKLSFFTHSYPHDWRTKKPVIFRATPQWFASIDKFRQQILDEIEKIDFMPDWGKTRLYNMIRDRGDWVISRQRAWGVPLPIFYAENGDPIMTKETIDHVAELFGKYGSNVWAERDAKDLLPDGFTYPGSPNGKFTKETDILDVWFDSGTAHAGVAKKRDNLKFPADLILEGSDQYRGWFNSMLVTSVAAFGVAPYKAILSQGFTLDKNGVKMSKSLGNVIAPSDIERQFGAEIIRLWVASVDSSSDVSVSVDSFKQVSETYRKIRNTIRFMLANTTDFDPKTNAVAYADLRPEDKYVVVKLNDLVKDVLADYDKYDFADVAKSVVSFIVNEMSTFYLDFAKDVVYIDAEDSHARRSMQTVIYSVAVKLAKLLTPILPHTMEQVWEYLKEPEDYIQLAEMPKVEEIADQAEIEKDWSVFMDFRDNVLKSLEVARSNKLIGKSLEAKVTIHPNAELKAVLDKIDSNFGQLLIVSQFEISDQELPETADKYELASVLVEKAEGKVCQRCRMIKTDVGSDSNYPTFCARCAKIVSEEYPQTMTDGFDE